MPSYWLILARMVRSIDLHIHDVHPCSLPVNLDGPHDNPSTMLRTCFDPESSHVIPALIHPLKWICDKRLEARERGDPLTGSHSPADGCVQGGQAEIVAWGDGSPTREFLHCGRCGRRHPSFDCTQDKAGNRAPQSERPHQSRQLVRDMSSANARDQHQVPD